MTITTTARNASLQDVVAILQDNRARAIDVVVPAADVRFKDGNVVISGLDNVLTDDGFMDPNGSYKPTDVADEGIGSKLKVPGGYLRTLRSMGRGDIFDAIVNGLLRGKSIRRAADVVEVLHAPDKRSFLLRLLRGDINEVGVLRAFLSPKYRVMDSLDALLALLQGLKDAGIQTTPEIDLTDKRMVVRIVVPEISAAAPALLAGYRSPFSGLSGDELPIMFAGLVFSNSEVGTGAWSITPRIVAQICTNGYTITKDADRQVHLGGGKADGVVALAEDTVEAELLALRLRTRDAVKTFLSPEYLAEAIAALEEKAGAPVQASKAPEVIKVVGQRLGFDKVQQAGILDYFMNGGVMTSGGIMHAVTAYAQDPAVDADTRVEMEDQAVKVLDLIKA